MAENRKKISKKKAAVKKTTAARRAAPGKLVLDTHVRISSAHALKRLLDDLLKLKQVTIDASKTEKIDTSGLQLLTAFAIEAEKRFIKIKWHNPATCVINAAKVLGLTDYLKLPSEIGSQR